MLLWILAFCFVIYDIGRMHIKNILAARKINLSFEFFPPKTAEGMERLFQTISYLQSLCPSFVSITYGAGGGRHHLTSTLLAKLKAQTSLELVAHLTMAQNTPASLRSALAQYQQMGIENVMALRGDPGESGPPPVGHAIELVQLVRQEFGQMGVGVAGFPEGHPECPNRLQEMDYLKAKVDAGADYICTQLFFDNHDFYDFRERCILAGIKVPILAGIMPLTSLSSMQRMAALALGMHFPAKLLRAVGRASSSAGVEEVGIHWATEQVRDLIDHEVAGIHFYTLNHSTATQRIWQGLGLRSALDLAEN